MHISPCPDCPRGCRPVPGDGPTPCRIMFIGEGPGRWEARKGRPFVGDTGAELDGLYLPLAGLERADVYVTNATRCTMPDLANPPVELAASCSKWNLADEIRQVQPEIVVPMGAIAAEALFGITNLELEHGLPRPAEYRPAGWSGLVLPTYHPSAGLHETGMMIQLREDFTAVAALLHGDSYRPVDYFAGLEDYRILATPDAVNSAMESAWDANPGGGQLTVAVDTENSSDGQPYCLSFSATPGTGYVVMADSTDCLVTLRRWTSNWRWVFHYALHDLAYLIRMGMVEESAVANGRIDYRDTMMLAYHRQNLPQGLKALAYRKLGMAMVDFEDLVLPYAEAAMGDWLAIVADPLGIGLDNPEYGKKPGKKRPEYGKKNPWQQQLAARQVSIDRKAARILLDKQKKPATDMFGRWAAVPEPDRLFIHSAMGGPPPGKGIEHLPVGLLARYAGRDADSTLRLWQWFEENPMETGVGE